MVPALVCVCLVALSSFAQETAPESVQDIITASDFFDHVSERYSLIEDYQALIVITQPDTIMTGVLSHKRPDMLLIEFDDPEDLVISVDGVRLQIYIPYLNVVMEQPLRPHDDTGIGLAAGPTKQGLELMKSRYTVAYLDTQDYTPLDEGSDEMVRKLKLEWRSIDEGFREIVLSIDSDLLVRRMEAVTAELDEISIDFLDVVINPGFPNQKFVWDSPPSANIIRNFIFDPVTQAAEE
jgi:outer membrane lipoprotein-sorting protein